MADPATSSSSSSLPSLVKTRSPCASCGSHRLAHIPEALAPVCGDCGHVFSTDEHTDLLVSDGGDGLLFIEGQFGNSNYVRSNLVGASESGVRTGPLRSAGGRVIHGGADLPSSVEGGDGDEALRAQRRQAALDYISESKGLPAVHNVIDGLLRDFKGSASSELARNTFLQARRLIKQRADEIKQKQAELIKQGITDEVVLKDRGIKFRWGAIAERLGIAIAWAVLRHRGISVLLEEVVAASPHKRHRDFKIISRYILILRSLFRRRTTIDTLERAQLYDPALYAPRFVDYVEKLKGASTIKELASLGCSTEDKRRAAQTITSELAKGKVKLTSSALRPLVVDMAEICRDEGISVDTGRGRRDAALNAWAIVRHAVEGLRKEPLSPAASQAWMAMLEPARDYAMECGPSILAHRAQEFIHIAVPDGEGQDDSASDSASASSVDVSDDSDSADKASAHAPLATTFINNLSDMKRMLDSRVRTLPWFDKTEAAFLIGRARVQPVRKALRSGTDAEAVLASLSSTPSQRASRRRNAKEGEKTKIMIRSCDETALMPTSLLCKYSADAMRLGAAQVREKERDRRQLVQRPGAPCGDGRGGETTPQAGPSTSAGANPIGNEDEASDAQALRRRREAIATLDPWASKYASDSLIRLRWGSYIRAGRTDREEGKETARLSASKLLLQEGGEGDDAGESLRALSRAVQVLGEASGVSESREKGDEELDWRAKIPLHLLDKLLSEDDTLLHDEDDTKGGSGVLGNEVDAHLFAPGEMESYMRAEGDREAVWRMRGAEWMEEERVKEGRALLRGSRAGGGKGGKRKKEEEEEEDEKKEAAKTSRQTPATAAGAAMATPTSKKGGGATQTRGAKALGPSASSSSGKTGETAPMKRTKAVDQKKLDAILRTLGRR